jgi:hypothetical protein
VFTEYSDPLVRTRSVLGAVDAGWISDSYGYRGADGVEFPSTVSVCTISALSLYVAVRATTLYVLTSLVNLIRCNLNTFYLFPPLRCNFNSLAIQNACDLRQ